MIALYRPTLAEVLNLWPNLRPEDPWRRFYLEARHLAGLAHERFQFDFLKKRWTIGDDANIAHVIDATASPPTCTCALFADDSRNMLQARGPAGVTRYCPATLAFVGYRRILANRFHDLGASRPPHVKFIFWQGLTQPATALDIFRFAAWLALTTPTGPMQQEFSRWAIPPQ
jgi:hypothetical protein